MKKLYLIRHGQSEGNVNEQVYNQVPDYKIELTEKGRLQAKAAGDTLVDIIANDSASTYCVIHSPWKRARDTAEIIKENLQGIPSFEDPLIYEQSIRHSFEEMHINPVEYNSPEKEAFGSYWYKTQTSESYADTYARARLFVNDLKNNYYDYDNLIIVSHGVFINMVLAVINKLPVLKILENSPPNNCEIIIENLK